jgi:hypothetical protein
MRPSMCSPSLITATPPLRAIGVHLPFAAYAPVPAPWPGRDGRQGEDGDHQGQEQDSANDLPRGRPFLGRRRDGRLARGGGDRRQVLGGKGRWCRARGGLHGHPRLRRLVPLPDRHVGERIRRLGRGAERRARGGGAAHAREGEH